VCKRDIHVGTGGDKNFKFHEKSKDHCKQLSISKEQRRPKLALTNFFPKRNAPITPHATTSSSTMPAPPLLSGSHSNISALTKSSSVHVEAIDVDMFPQEASDGGPLSPDPKPSLIHPSLQRLQDLATRLPSSIPLGQISDTIAIFSHDPRLNLVTDEDPWETLVDPTLNRVIGYGKQTVEIAGLIRRGEYGIDGFCNYIKICINDLNIAPALLETRLERVADAVKLL
jgi:hypothetical protein